MSPAAHEPVAPQPSAHRGGPHGRGGDSSAALLAANSDAVATYESRIAWTVGSKRFFLRVDCSGTLKVVTCTGQWSLVRSTGAATQLEPLAYDYTDGRVTPAAS